MVVAPGTRIEVHSGDDSDQDGGSVTNGAFRSADAGSITLTLANGHVRTLERDAVRRVRVRRPFFDRPAGWRAYLVIIGIMEIDVNVAEGAVVPRDHVVIVAVDHSIRTRRHSGQQVGVTACLSSRQERCTGVTARTEGRAAELPSPLTLRLRLADRFPFGAPLSMYVHVVIVDGSSWRPVGDMRIPRPGDSGVLGAVTVTRRITVGDR